MQNSTSPGPAMEKQQHMLPHKRAGGEEQRRRQRSSIGDPGMACKNNVQGKCGTPSSCRTAPSRPLQWRKQQHAAHKWGRKRRQRRRQWWLIGDQGWHARIMFRASAEHLSGAERAPLPATAMEETTTYAASAAGQEEEAAAQWQLHRRSRDGMQE